MELRIKRNITLPYISELYETIFKENSTFEIFLPKDIERSSFGVIPSFIQFFATAIRHQKCSELNLPYKEKEDLEIYIEVEFVYPLIVLAWNTPIFNSKKQEVKDVLKKLSQKYFKKIDFLKVKPVRSLPVYSFDHDIVQRGLSRFFYDSNFKLAPLDQLEFNLHPIFKKISIAHNTKDGIKSMAPITESLSRIIYELFKNTHEHARTKINGGYYFPNIRCVTLKTIRRKKSAYLKDKNISNAAKEYFVNNLPLTEQSDFIMLEVSILDSGPGLACRMAGINSLNNLSILKELEYTKKCLLKHKTSSRAYLSSVKGKGLDQVMQLLDKKGFLRIRTGRLDLFRNFITDPYTDSNNVSNVILKDFNSNSLNYTEHPKVSGTLHTFYYPISGVS